VWARHASARHASANVYAVIRTTVYLPEELKRRLERTARDRCTSEAEVIRAALDEHTAKHRPRPRLPLSRGNSKTNIADRVDEILAEGFGRD
jgi:Arc/MetJ-type ribon-helix-helix transcriptional regulator